MSLVREKKLKNLTRALVDLNVDLFEGVESGHGFSANSMCQVVYFGSYPLAVCDFLKHHPDRRSKRVFANLELYHFSPNASGLWTSAQKPAIDHGWIETGKTDKFINLVQLYRVISEYLAICTNPKNKSSQSLMQSIRLITKENLPHLPIKYGKKLETAFNNVIDATHRREELVRIIMGGYIVSAEFDRLVREHNLSKHLLGGIEKFRESCFSSRNGHSLIRPDWIGDQNGNFWRDLFKLDDRTYETVVAAHQVESIGFDDYMNRLRALSKITN